MSERRRCPRRRVADGENLMNYLKLRFLFHFVGDGLIGTEPMTALTDFPYPPPPAFAVSPSGLRFVLKHRLLDVVSLHAYKHAQKRSPPSM